jgi:hypothetical protein
MPITFWVNYSNKLKVILNLYSSTDAGFFSIAACNCNELQNHNLIKYTMHNLNKAGEYANKAYVDCMEF